MRIVLFGEDILREVSEPISAIDQEVVELAEAMFDTMYRERGIGLAAVQVGRLVRMFITHVPDDEPRVYINPEIIGTSIEEWKYEEGCLSIPGLNADVIRPAAVKIQALNLRGRAFTLDAEGLLGRAIQHELDHLNGVLFLDKLKPKKREKLLKDYDPVQAQV